MSRVPLCSQITYLISICLRCLGNQIDQGDFITKGFACFFRHFHLLDISARIAFHPANGLLLHLFLCPFRHSRHFSQFGPKSFCQLLCPAHTNLITISFGNIPIFLILTQPFLCPIGIIQLLPLLLRYQIKCLCLSTCISCCQRF
ncbi:hypothetical protein D3C76_1411570 [compost metagenome]